jgi:hypothetical protein
MEQDSKEKGKEKKRKKAFNDASEKASKHYQRTMETDVES